MVLRRSSINKGRVIVSSATFHLPSRASKNFNPSIRFPRRPRGSDGRHAAPILRQKINRLRFSLSMENMRIYPTLDGSTRGGHPTGTVVRRISCMTHSELRIMMRPSYGNESRHNRPAGCGPAAAPFFASPKKEAKKATAQRRPSGSQNDRSQSGKRGKLACGSNSPRFFIRFDSDHFGAVAKRNSSGTT